MIKWGQVYEIIKKPYYNGARVYMYVDIGGFTDKMYDSGLTAYNWIFFSKTWLYTQPMTYAYVHMHVRT